MAKKTTKKKAGKRSKLLTKDELLGSVGFEHVAPLDERWERVIESTESADARAICLSLMLLATEVHEIRWEGLSDQGEA